MSTEKNRKNHFSTQILLGMKKFCLTAGFLSITLITGQAVADPPSIIDMIQDESYTFNEQKFGNYLSDLYDDLDPASELKGVLDQLESLNPPGGISLDALNAMSMMDGSFYGSLGMVNSMNHTVLNQQISNQLRPKNYCSCLSDSCECCSPRKNLWGKYYNISGEFDSDGNACALDYDVNTVLIGGDWKLDSGDRFGGYFGYSGGSAQTSDRLEQSDTNDYIFGLYFLRTNETGYFLANSSWGYNDHQIDRNIRFANVNEYNTSSMNSNEFDLRLEKGLDFWFDSTKLEPFLALQYLSSSFGSLDETGTGATALSVQMDDWNSLQTELGARLIWADKPNRTRKTSLYVQGSWIHEYLDQKREINSRFQSAPNKNVSYAVQGLDSGSDFCNVGFGASGTWNRITLFGSYDFLMNDLVFLPVGSFGCSLNW